MGQSVGAHSEVLGDHTQVEIPVFVVADWVTIKRLESVRANIVGQSVPSKDFRCDLLHVLLVVDDSDDHALQDEIGLARVCVRLRQRPIRQRVVAIVKLCNIASKVFHDCELSTWVNLLVP